MHSTVTNPSRVNALWSGWYDVRCAADMANGAGRSTLDIYVNGTTQVAFDRRMPPDSGDITLRVNKKVLLTAGQYIQCRINATNLPNNLQVDGASNRTPMLEVELLKFSS